MIGRLATTNDPTRSANRARPTDSHASSDSRFTPRFSKPDSKRATNSSTMSDVDSVPSLWLRRRIGCGLDGGGTVSGVPGALRFVAKERTSMNAYLKWTSDIIKADVHI